MNNLRCDLNEIHYKSFTEYQGESLPLTPCMYDGRSENGNVNTGNQVLVIGLIFIEYQITNYKKFIRGHKLKSDSINLFPYLYQFGGMGH